MAEIPVTITGVITDLDGNTISPGPVKLVGSMAKSDVGVGGGPIQPPPPGIWPGPGDPDFPGGGGGGGKPPGIWPGPGDPDFPGGLPDPPTKPPEKQLVWGFSVRNGQWLQVYVPGEGEAAPKDR